MIVEELTAIPLEVRLTRPFSGSTYTITKRCTTVVRISVDGGRSATIWGGDEKSYGLELAGYLNGPIRDVLVGRDPTMVTALWTAMADMVREVQSVEPDEARERHLRMKAIALADIALWALLAEVADMPLYRVMGGYSSALPVIGIVGYHTPGSPLDGLRREVERCANMGLGGVKLKVGHGTLKEDLARIGAVREVGGRDFMIACDANMGWSLAQATSFVRALEAEKFELIWLEEPVGWLHQYDGMSRLRERQSTPICSGQNEILATECKQLILRGCVDVLNTDVTVCGGITPWRDLAGMAALWPSVRMAHHEEPQIAMHLLASAPNAVCVELFPDPARDPIWDGLPASKPKISQGKLHLPDGPGLGVEIDWDFVDKWKVA
ncbi:MAG: mandelate racemase/muconate lactonizing enzyme family protein [Candidatus Bipolaricaulota bacterium]